MDWLLGREKRERDASDPRLTLDLRPSPKDRLIDEITERVDRAEAELHRRLLRERDAH